MCEFNVSFKDKHSKETFFLTTFSFVFEVALRIYLRNYPPLNMTMKAIKISWERVQSSFQTGTAASPCARSLCLSLGINSNLYKVVSSHLISLKLWSLKTFFF